MKKLFLLLVTVLAMSLYASAQTRTVSGTVLDADTDEPILGASVVPMGGGHGAMTNIDGQFSLQVPAKVTKLRVSYVGYTTQEVAAGANITVKLHSTATDLDEVMVVAYGTAKKSAFTGSAAVVDASDIEKTQASNVLDALVGKVAGVQTSNATGQPGGSTPTIRVRGFSSILAGNSPLIVVDGTPFSGDMNTLNTNDIASMTILKDAASNALYGARGANGVILITTKRAKKGEATVTLDAKWGMNSRATQDYDVIKSPAQFYETFYKSLYNYAVCPTEFNSEGEQIGGGMGYTPSQANIWANQNLFDPTTYGLGYNVYNVPDGQMLIGMNGKLNPNATLGNIVTYNGQQYMLRPDNWLDESYKNSLRQEYNLSVSQGTEKSNFFASASYLRNEGIVKAKSDFERFTGRLTADTQAKDWLKVGGNMSYTHYKANSLDDDGSSNSTGNIFAAATQIAPIYPMYMRDASGNIIRDKMGYKRYDYGAKDNVGIDRPIYGDSNALSQAILDTNSSEGNAMTATGFFEVRFLKDFKFTSNNTMNLDETRYTSVTNPYYGQYASQNGIVSKEHDRAYSFTYQQLLNWDRTFGKHSVGVLLGHETYTSKSAVLSASKSNMFDPSLKELATAVTDGSANSYTGEYNNEGYLFRGQYDYDTRYFASVSFRRDASSRFHPDHRWGNFYSVGGAWIISKESFFNVPWINLLKFKASYGEQGNDNIGSYRYTNTYTIVNSNGHPAAKPNTMGNKNITWEKNGNFNAGVEFGMWNDRLSGSVEGFYRKTSDMLMSFPLAPSFGYTSYYANVGDMTNAGIELELNGVLIHTRDFTWSANVNLTWYKNEIAALPESRKGMTVDGVRGFSSGSYFYGEGQPMYTFHMKKYAGVNEKGEAMYWKNVTDPATGKVSREKTTAYSDGSYYLCGTALPDVYGGFGTQLSYKGFDLSLAFSYQIGGQVYDADYASYMSSPTSGGGRGNNLHADILKAWTPDNTGSSIPRYQWGDLNSTSTSDRFLTDASYLSLNNINFGYTLPDNVVKKLQLKSLRFYLACENVWVWSKRQGLDPRQSLTGAVNNTYYAPIRTISGGLTLSF